MEKLFPYSFTCDILSWAACCKINCDGGTDEEIFRLAARLYERFKSGKTIVVKMMCGNFFRKESFTFIAAGFRCNFIGDLFSFQDDYYYAKPLCFFWVRGRRLPGTQANGPGDPGKQI